jgi:hypothetical protein
VRRTSRAIAPLLATLIAAVAAPLRAQDPEPGPRGGVPILSAVWRALKDSSRAEWARPLASLVLPGSGQILGEHDRGAVYLVTEAFFLTRYFALSAQGRRDRSRYRDLAFIVARGAFAPATTDTVFEYYEQMGKFIESGPFDADPGSGFAPATDPRSYNGAIWQLARETFFANPDSTPATTSEEYQHAIAFYNRRAIGPNFQWSWRNAGIEQDLYDQTIASSDQAFRRASEQLGLLLANHLLSAIDAFIANRLHVRGHPVAVVSGLVRGPSAADGISGAVMLRIAF